MMSTATFLGSINQIRFSATDSNFKICTMRVVKVIEGDLQPNQYGDVVFKGEMSLVPQTNYIIKGELIDDPKFGKQYKYLFSKRENPVEEMSVKDFRIFLTDISSKGHLINEEYEDPRPLFQKHDFDALTSIKGIGPATAEKLIEKFEAQKDYSPAYVAFGKWGFTMQTTRKLVGFMKSVDDAVRQLKEDPYYFMKVKGIGFKTIDQKARDFGIAVNDKRRVHAYINNYFDELAMSGSSWIKSTKLIHQLEKEIFDCDVKEVVKWINDSDEYTVFSKNGEKRIATTKLFKTEQSVADNIKRLLNAKPDLEVTANVEEIVTNVEQTQGWQYSEAQRQAISTLLNNNVVILRGVAGSGKTSTLNAVVKILQASQQSIATCALSGKAADNLTQITKLQGRTIHRLLGIRENMIMFTEKCPLPYDVIILDEVSMVDVSLFDKLVSAIRNGAKLIMVGDSAQLDSIGVGVMRDLIFSGVAPVVTLKEIHRQAKESAIITHSLTYRQGKMPPVSKQDSWSRMGERKDLGYVFEDDGQETNIQSDVYKIFKHSLKQFDVKDVQILASTTRLCDEINKAAQVIANPKSGSKNEYEVFPGKEYSYVLREGDKIINVANNYRTVSADNESEITPIYNGNTGLIESIRTEYDSKGRIKDVNMIVKLDGVGRVLIDKSKVKQIRLGYAITVHKSQGSTIPCVIIALPFQYMLNSRELLYTAMTRSSEECYLVTSMKTLKATTAKTSKTVHRSSLADFLKKEG